MSNTIDTDSLKSSVSVLDLAGAVVELRKKGAKEHEAPCPKCGGNNRFYVTDTYFACRQCHPKRGDAIEFLMWTKGLGFLEACEELGHTNYDRLFSGKKIAPEPAVKAAQSQGWRDAAGERMAEARELLQCAEAAPGRAYLEGRGLNHDTWIAYGLGFVMAYLPYTWDSETKKPCHPKQPAIAIPWYGSDGALTGIRYRFLETHAYTDLAGRERRENKTALYGSDFTGKLFGSHAIDPSSIPAERTLIVVEGEINAMSIYQNANRAGVDVLSIGSQGQKPKDLARLTERYKKVIIWADEPQIAKSLMSDAPGAYGVSSPSGKDANDLLKAGHLGGYLSAWRMNQCEDEGQIAKLYSWLLVAKEKGLLDKGAEKVMNTIAQKLPAVEIQKPTITLAFEPTSTLYGPTEGFKQWLWGMMQTNAEVLADMYTLCGYLLDGSQEVIIEHPHADVLLSAAKYLIKSGGNA